MRITVPVLPKRQDHVRAVLLGAPYTLDSLADLINRYRARVLFLSPADFLYFRTVITAPYWISSESNLLKRGLLGWFIRTTVVVRKSVKRWNLLLVDEHGKATQVRCPVPPPRAAVMKLIPNPDDEAGQLMPWSSVPTGGDSYKLVERFPETPW